MSVKENEVWLEASYEHFQGALQEGNVSLAKAVIADVAERGFAKQAYKMAQELQAVTDINTAL